MKLLEFGPANQPTFPMIAISWNTVCVFAIYPSPPLQFLHPRYASFIKRLESGRIELELFGTIIGQFVKLDSTTVCIGEEDILIPMQLNCVLALSK